MKNNMVVTTSLFDLNRQNWNNYNRPIEEYKKYAQNMLSLDCDMVIYTTSDLKSFFEDNRKLYKEKTIIITMDLKDIPYYDYLDRITNLMTSDFFVNKIRNAPGIDRYRPEANYPIYNIIQFAKSKFLKMTIDNDYFKSKYHCWMDVGIYHDKFPQKYKFEKFPSSNLKILSDEKIHHFYIDHPRESDLNKLEYYSMLGDVRMTGGWFGGTKNAMLLYSDLIENVVNQSIHEGVISDDQNMYTIAYLQNKNKFHLHDGNFAVNPWFAGLDYFMEKQ